MPAMQACKQLNPVSRHTDSLSAPTLNPPGHDAGVIKVAGGLFQVGCAVLTCHQALCVTLPVVAFVGRATDLRTIAVARL